MLQSWCRGVRGQADGVGWSWRWQRKEEGSYHDTMFIPTHDSINSLELTQLFLTYIFSKHGTPSHVTSDWDSEFVSHFFQSLGKLLQMELHFTSGYHLEGDRQTEHLNQVLEQYL